MLCAFLASLRLESLSWNYRCAGKSKTTSKKGYELYNKILNNIFIFSLFVALIASIIGCDSQKELYRNDLLANFKNPPKAAHPGVYWYFMDGNLSRTEMTADLESMKEAGIFHLVFLEVNVGVPRGSVDLLSEEWQDLFKHAVREAERLGIEITLGVGPGWSGSGGPWVKPEQSMQHLVASITEVEGPIKFSGKLPVPLPRRPYFGEGGLTEKMREQWLFFYEDVCVLAFPTPKQGGKIEDSDEKALYYRAPYSSRPKVKPFLAMPGTYQTIPEGSAIQKNEIVELTSALQEDGRLAWNVPEGGWTIMRFGKRNNGAITRPAPQPGLGFESDKFDRQAFDDHFDKYVGTLIRKVQPKKVKSGGGWTMLHMDSWEMGAQNWTKEFQKEFKSRRGYDLLPFLPTYLGFCVENMEMSERFLWDIRKTAQELVLENHAGRIKELGRQYNFGLSIEPYDMNPCADLDLGALADVPMCEFWSIGYGFNTSYSCFEATSIAHITGQPVVAAEAFTASGKEAWKLYPGKMKNQGDWALSTGINRFVYHTFAHKPLGSIYRPGMSMGPYGVHWDRGQTWWPFVSTYHKYIARCSYLLQQGNTEADILYLTPEGAPHVFLPPRSALTENDTIPDRRGYNFDGCSPDLLISLATVEDNKIVFPGGASYPIMVLPAVKTMTPELLNKLELLVKQGASIIGTPPSTSPSLVNYPQCDIQVSSVADRLWGGMQIPKHLTVRYYGEGKIFWGGDASLPDSAGLYPEYNTTAKILEVEGVIEDFRSTGPIRYTHRRTDDLDIYFVSNRSDKQINVDCEFRINEGVPELWDPQTGEARLLPDYSHKEGVTRLSLEFDVHQSYFILFDKNRKTSLKGGDDNNFKQKRMLAAVEGPWQVSFDPKWGGPESVIFNYLDDWTKRPEKGIRYYSGIAVYRQAFDLPVNITLNENSKLYLDLGEVNHLARVHLNGEVLGVLWTAPWSVDISGAVRRQDNALEIEVVNLWPNRLIGDEQLPFDGIKDGQWPDWLVKGQKRSSGRYTFTVRQHYKADSPLIKSGLIGPVRIVRLE